MPTEDNQEDPRSTSVLGTREAPTGRQAGKPEDLSAEIAATVERRPGDVVKCTKVGGDRYRCNWWAAEATAGYDNPGMGGLLVTTHRVRQSQFLHVTRSKSGGLVIRVSPSGPG